jgi:arylsulfatase A-like enzyme
MMPTYSRRTFLKQSAVIAGVIGAPSTWLRAARTPHFPDQPNLILIITDQERDTQWFPADWEQKNLPHLQRLKSRGLSFTNAFCNTSMCTPSRATLLTGLYPNQHGLADTLPEGARQENHEKYTVLDPAMQNLAGMLKSAGYQVFYKGKWHLSYPAGAEWTAEDVAKYGFDGWNPPDGGEDTAPENFGGGRANHDERCLQDTLKFLENVDPGQPFALVVSFINPHDVAGFPNNYELDYPESMLQGEIELPPTVDENLEQNFKPHAHAEVINRLALGLGTLLTPLRKKQYLNFYGNLLKKVDAQIGQVLDALEKPRPDGSNLADSTLVIRTADHGEMGLCHGGMRQKMFNVYEETLRLPLVFSNPVLFPQACSSDALVSLIDLMPTLATLAKVTAREKWVFKGVDFSPIISDPMAPPVQDAVLFVFDDIKAGQENIEQMVTPPNRIRCIREQRWKFARYFDGNGEKTAEFEMYDLVNDPPELQNLAHPQHPRYNEPTVVAERIRLAEKLQQLETARLEPVAAQVAPNQSGRLPDSFKLWQNYPNPFNPRTEIRYTLPGAAFVWLKVYDRLGREVRTLVAASQPAGVYHVIFHAQGLASGTYWYSITVNDSSGNSFKQTKQMVLLK